MVRLDRQKCSDNDDTYEISIYVAPDRYRLGLGAAGLSLARRLVPQSVLIAEVLPENVASEKLFLSAGYTRRQDGYFHSSPIET